MLILIMLFPNIIVTKNLALVWHEYNNPVIEYQIFLLQYQNINTRKFFKECTDSSNTTFATTKYGIF